jgi:phage baseplate assembly protein V
MKVSRAESLHRPFNGVCTGIVEKDEDKSKEGRVKVRFLWLDNRTITDWCRVAQPYAGNKYGIMFVPEAGDEVLLSFIHGDMNEPVVVGGLYSEKDKPPGYRLDSFNRKVIRTKAGHELRFDDAEPSITLTSKNGHVLSLDDKAKNATLQTAGGHTVELDDNGGTVTVKHANGKASIKLDSSGGVTIDGATIKLTAQQISIG